MIWRLILLTGLLILASCAGEKESAHATQLSRTRGPELPPEDAVFGIKAARIVYDKFYQGHHWHDTLWFEDWGRRGVIIHQQGTTQLPFFSFIRNGDTVGYIHHYDSTYWVWRDTGTTLASHHRSGYPGFRDGRLKSFSRYLRLGHATADSAAGRHCLYARKYDWQIWFWQGIEWQQRLAGSDLLFRAMKVEYGCPLPADRLRIPNGYAQFIPPPPVEVPEEWDPEAIRIPFETAVCY